MRKFVLAFALVLGLTSAADARHHNAVAVVRPVQVVRPVAVVAPVQVTTFATTSSVFTVVQPTNAVLLPFFSGAYFGR